MEEISTMSSSHSLRDFIRERLTAAADEIFTEFDKTIIQYEEELDRQRRMLEIGCKPQTHVQTTDLQKNIWRKEEILTDQRFCIQEKDLILDHGEPEPQQLKKNKEGLETLLLIENFEEPEPQQMKNQQGEPEPLPRKDKQGESEPQQMKEEEVELSISVKEKQLELQLETDSSAVNDCNEGRDIIEPELNMDQLRVKISPEPETQNQKRIQHQGSGSSRDEERKENEKPTKTKSNSDWVDGLEVERRKKTTINEMSPCKLCGQNLTRRNFNRHMIIHTGERPFSCLTCGKSFSEKQTI